MNNKQKTLSANEMQDIKDSLFTQFNKNMNLFRRANPAFYNKFKNHQVSYLKLVIEPDGVVQLVNAQPDAQGVCKPVYPSNPKSYIREQVKKFIANPFVVPIRPVKTPVMNEGHGHTVYSNELINLTDSWDKETPSLDLTPAGLLLMSGCGMGYQIEQLIQSVDIKNIIIFDPYEDSFYASLYTSDWTSVVEYITGKSGLIEFYIGSQEDALFSRMKALRNDIGLHNIANTFLFRHFNSEQETQFSQRYAKENHLNYFGSGFFDDEQVGLSHTIHNLNNDIKMFKVRSPEDVVSSSMFPSQVSSKSSSSTMTAVIVGNGPSLDSQLEFLQKNKSNVIIFSCGTSLSSIAKLGIKPDFHIEMERNINVKEWLEIGTTASFRRGITLLCLNTVAPEVIELFDDAYMAKKSNDIGEGVIDSVYPNDEVLCLDNVNPTVTNAGLSFALNMGFKNVVLLGVDLGLHEDGSHHSKLSLYQDLEEKTKHKGHSDFENTDGNYFVEANFGGEIYTNSIFDNSKIILEKAFSQYQVEYTKAGLSLYGINPSRGASILGFAAVEINKVEVDLIEKQDVLKSIKKNINVNSKRIQINVDEYKRYIHKDLNGFFKELELPESVNNSHELDQACERIFRYVKSHEQTDTIKYTLFFGSINTFFMTIKRACDFIPLEKYSEEFPVKYGQCRALYMKFLTGAYELLNSNPLKLDDTFDKTAVKLKEYD